MKFTSNITWLDPHGPDCDIVSSCRVRIARNVAGFPFARMASRTELNELSSFLCSVLLNGELADDMIWVDLDSTSPQDRKLLVERHLISKQHAENEGRRGVAVSGDETLSVMVNEEDHLRMQMMASGLQFRRIYEEINAIDDRIEEHVDYAFDQRWGYLTACPTNVGTGVRFSAMMHLPALRITNEIERVKRAAKDLHLAVRGYYGEGSESAGDFYQVSNQVTLGNDEQALLGEFNDVVVPRIIQYERQARQLLVERNSTMLDDRVHRALGTLRSARLIGVEEAMKLLSRVRLGASLQRLTDVDIAAINRLFVQVQPAHLQAQAHSALNSDELRAARASIIRENLG